MHALLEDATTPIICLTLHNLADRLAQLGIWNMGLACSLGKPRCLEDALQVVIYTHI